MVRTAGINHESPINLFRQNEAHQLMRHREPAKGNLRIRTFQHELIMSLVAGRNPIMKV